MSNHTKVFVNKPSGRHYSQLLGGLKIVPLQQNVALRPTTGTQTKAQQKFYYKFVCFLASHCKIRQSIFPQ